MTKNYLNFNKQYWEKGYSAPCVDHNTFRFYGRILKPQFNLPSNNEKLLDFGCGQGSAVNYFQQQGFDAYGVDISEKDISIAKKIFPHLKDKFLICDPDPKLQQDYGNQTKYKVITAFQSLYYFTKSDFEFVLECLNNQLETGGIFFATMMGTSSKEFYENSIKTDDEYLRKVDFKNDRVNVKDYYMFFVENEDDLLEKFKIFKPIHTGYYCSKFRSDEGDGFHYNFCGMKK